MKKLTLISLAVTCFCACNESVEYRLNWEKLDKAKCIDDYHYIDNGDDGYTTTACCGDAEIAAGTCKKVCVTHETGAACEAPKKPSTGTVIEKPVARCGNGIVESGESCDSTQLNGHSCADKYGVNAEGSVVCNTSCQIQYDNCRPNADNCGNGILDEGEDCDGEQFKETECSKYVDGSNGTLKCTNQCQYDITDCRMPLCGNGIVDPGEACDTVVPDDLTCNKVINATVGELSCNHICQLDSSNCIKPQTGDLCNDENFYACEGDNYIACSDGHYQKTNCSAYYSDTCVILQQHNRMDYISGCLDRYLECDNPGEISFQCDPVRTYESTEMVCLKDTISNRNFWYNLDGGRTEVCPYSCNKDTGKCARLAPNEGELCDIETFDDYCDGKNAVSCVGGNTMYSVSADSCADGCAVFSISGTKVSTCTYSSDACEPGSPRRTLCLYSDLVEQGCYTTLDNSGSRYINLKVTHCDNGCDPDTLECIKLSDSDGKRCSSNSNPRCSDGNVLVYCSDENKFTSRACQINGEGLCTEDAFGADCRETCTNPGETRSTCIDNGDEVYVKYEKCVEKDGQLIFETEDIESCGWACNADKTGCFSVSEYEGESCTDADTRCDGDTLLICKEGKIVAYYCPVYDAVCATDSDEGANCYDICMNPDENYYSCAYSDTYENYINYEMQCDTDSNGVVYAYAVEGDVCANGCNNSYNGCDYCTPGDIKTICSTQDRGDYTFYIECVGNSEEDGTWQYAMNGEDYMYDSCPDGCDADGVSCAKSIPEIGQECDTETYESKCVDNVLLSCSNSGHVDGNRCTDGSVCASSSKLGIKTCAVSCKRETEVASACYTSDGVSFVYNSVCESVDDKLLEFSEISQLCSGRCNKSNTACAE